MRSPGLYVMNFLNSAVIPDDCATCEQPIESLYVELRSLRSMLQQTTTAINNLKKSHIINQRAYNRSRRQLPDLTPTLLSDSLGINPDVKLDVEYLPSHDELAINSSLF